MHSKRSENISLKVFGSGHPLLLIHGWGMSGAAWRFQIPLSSRYRLIIPDLPGHGDSYSTASEDYSASRYADLLAERLKKKLSEPLLIAGWSLGSMIAMRLYLKMKDKAAGVLLVGATPKFCNDETYSCGLPEQDVRGLKLRLKRKYGETMGDFFKRMFSQGELDHNQYQKIVREIILPGRQPSLETALSALDTLSSEDLREDLKDILHPTLIIHGMEDDITPPSSARYLADHIPHSSLQLLPGIGHAPFMSRPEEFNSTFSNFAQEVFAS